MKVAAAALLLTMALIQDPALAAFGGQNGRIAFTRSHGPLSGSTTTLQIHTANPDGSGMTAITSTSPSRYPAWSPNGARIAFARGNSLLTVDQNGANQQTVLTWTDAVGAIDWSPDGARLVVELPVCDSQGECRLDIHTLNANGTGLTDVTPDVFDDRNPSWSPDGTRIAFDSTKGEGNQDIYTVLLDGSDQVRLTTDASTDANPDWSPDGAKLAFESNRSLAGRTSGAWTRTAPTSSVSGPAREAIPKSTRIRHGPPTETRSSSPGTRQASKDVVTEPCGPWGRRRQPRADNGSG